MKDTMHIQPTPSGHNQPAHPALLAFALALGAFSIGTAEFSAMPLLPLIAKAFDIGAPEAGHMISAYALGVVVGAPLIMLTTVSMRRRTLLIGLTLFVAATHLASALVPDFRTLLLTRFLSGLPHGAFMGSAAVLAASTAPAGRRATAVARVFLGLTIATIIGVPVATALSQIMGWQACMLIVAGLAVVSALCIARFAPATPVPPGASPFKELRSLASRTVWLTLGVCMIGFGGLFCIYTYLADTVLRVTHAAPGWIPVIMMVFGLGTTVGNLVGGSLADRSAPLAAAGMLIFSTIVLLIYPSTTAHLAWLVPTVFLVGAGIGLSAVLQTWLTDMAPQGQAAVSALLQCAFNLANAIGPWAGGLAIAAGYGFAATGYVAAALSFGGLLLWVLAYRSASDASGVGAAA
ncbi:MFS transporter [Frateuria aurantia]